MSFLNRDSAGTSNIMQLPGSGRAQIKTFDYTKFEKLYQTEEDAL